MLSVRHQGRKTKVRYIHYNIGYQSRGNIVEVTLSGSLANVRLLDSSNFRKYQSGKKHCYYGGLIRRSPARLLITHSGYWHVNVDMQGLVGKTWSSDKLISGEALSPLSEYSPKSISNLVQHHIPDEYNEESGKMKSINMNRCSDFPKHAAIPHVSFDGKFLFLSSRRDIYWVDAKIIEELKPIEQK